jgi:pimeloyl-ACP methyl ester carboxylesterase
MNAVPARSERIDTGTGMHLRAITWGLPETHRQAPLVLVHGLASNAMLWEGTALELAKLGHMVMAIDLRGHGLSDKPDSGYDMGSVADDLAGLLRLIDERGFHRPVIGGQSWGGNVVIELAHTHPELVRGVCAVDGGFLELQQHFPKWDECVVALRPPAIAGMRADHMRKYMCDAHPDWPETGIDGMMANMEHLPDGTIRPWLTLERHLMVLHGLWEHRPTDIFPLLTVPVLFVPADGPNGAFAETKREAIQRSLELVPQARVEWFRSADHDLHAQQPQRLALVLHDATIDGFFT